MSSHAAAAEPVILVFGDSLSAGYGLGRDTGWVSLLERQLAQEKLGYRVVNASISGETTAGGVRRIESALAAHHPAVVILELGANDGLRGLPNEQTRDNLNAMIAACKKQRARVLLVGMQLPPNYGIAYTEKFRLIYPQLAVRHNKLALVPFMLEGLADQRDLFQADNFHPNAEAQPLLLQNIWRHLQPLLNVRN